MRQKRTSCRIWGKSSCGVRNGHTHRTCMKEHLQTKATVPPRYALHRSRTYPGRGHDSHSAALGQGGSQLCGIGVTSPDAAGHRYPAAASARIAGLTAGAWAGRNANVDRANTVVASSVGGVDRCLLCARTGCPYANRGSRAEPEGSSTTAYCPAGPGDGDDEDCC